MKKFFFRLFIIGILIFLSSGCSDGETYGGRISGRKTTPIKDILLDPKAYDGKTVTIKGKIMIECETGCWFNFKEGDEMILVNLEPSGIAIPQKAGHNAIVEGNVIIKEGKPTVIGKGVKVQ